MGQRRQQLAYVILMELLAYQFALPVHWTEMQDLLTSFNFEHLVPCKPNTRRWWVGQQDMRYSLSLQERQRDLLPIRGRR